MRMDLIAGTMYMETQSNEQNIYLVAERQIYRQKSRRFSRHIQDISFNFTLPLGTHVRLMDLSLLLWSISRLPEPDPDAPVRA